MSELHPAESEKNILDQYIVDAESLILTHYNAHESESNDESIFNGLQHFWYSNGYQVGKNPRQDIAVIPDLNQTPYTILRSSYIGLEEEEVIDRQHKLHGYSLAWLDYKRSNPNVPPAICKQKQADLIRQHVGTESNNGLQGVETFSLTITTSAAVAERAVTEKLVVSEANIAAWHSYSLPEEQKTYDTPTFLGGYPAFTPYQERTFSVVSGYFKGLRLNQ
jgi:hypothetical protein